MIAFITSIVGPRFAKPAFYVLIGLIILASVFALARCTGTDNTAQKQAEQTTRSGEAISDAAKDAISTIGDSVATEKTIDQAVAQTQEDIDHAQDPDAIRAVVVGRLCSQASHRNDPACKVQ